MIVPPRPEFNGDYFLAFGLAERQAEWDKNFTNMSKAKAFDAIRSGYKITHVRFLQGEYIHMKDGQILDENDFCLANFWHYRKGPAFENGWNIVTKD